MHFEEMSIEILSPYFSWFVFFPLSCSSFYILDIKHLFSSTLYVVFSLSCIGEGHGTPLQCSCLENPRGGGAWWAAVYGVAQSRTGLK